MVKEYQRFERSEQGDTLFFRQIEKQRITEILPIPNNEKPVVSVPDGQGVWIAVGKYGICINGEDFGNNPPATEMQEWVEVMRECVAWYDEHFEDNS